MHKTNTPLTLYQVILVTDRAYYVLQGLVPNPKAKAYLPIFRAVADTFVPQL